MKSWRSIAGAAVIISFFWAGCANPEKNVDKRMSTLREAWSTNILRQANLPERPLDWPTAWQIMLAQNAKLRQGRIDITNSRENIRQIYRELVPTVNARAGVTKDLANLDKVSFDDVTFSADSFFNVPGLVNMTARVYAAKLALLRSRTAYALAEREQSVELYRLFHAAQELAAETDKLKIQRATAKAMLEIDPFSGRLMETELRNREMTSQREQQALQERASILLGSHSHRWILTTNGLPQLRYHEEALPLADTNRVAQLQLKLAALELEGARVMIKGMKLRYWPELNIFVSGPPIFQRIAGRERVWDADLLRGSADLYWQLDTRGHIGRQIRQTKRTHAMQRERFEQETLALMDRLLLTQQLLGSTLEQANRVDRQVDFLLAAPPAQTFASVQQYAYDYRNLTQQQLRLRRELAEFNALFWFMDESAWPTPSYELQ